MASFKGLVFLLSIFNVKIQTSIGQHIFGSSWESLDEVLLKDGMDNIASSFILDEDDFSQSLERAFVSSDTLTPLCKEHLQEYAQALNSSIFGKDMPYWAVKSKVDDKQKVQMKH